MYRNAAQEEVKPKQNNLESIASPDTLVDSDEFNLVDDTTVWEPDIIYELQRKAVIKDRIFKRLERYDLPDDADEGKKKGE